MNLAAVNSAAPLLRHFSDVGLLSWTKRKRSKREFDDDYFAGCLIALARSGGATTSSTAIADAKKHTKLSSSKATITSYNCTLCGKAFSSRRGLGRHNSSHRSKPPTAAADNDRKTSASASDCASGSKRIHNCSVCCDIFATGLALGGHKRKHYGGAISRNCCRKSRVNSSDGGAGSTDASSFSDGNGAVDMAPIARNLELKLPLSPSPYLDPALKL